ncbi:MAG: hypothetical protein MRY32_04990 [Rickettsiales bacterium]|nr:hypothetical protein [Rickettsiales bacterium]
MALLKKRGFGMIIGGIILFLFYQIYSADGNPDPSNPNSFANPNPNIAPSDAAVQQTIKFENGNSAFSSNLLKRMNEAELSQYSHVFYFAMSNKKDGETHKWNFYNTHGEITPTSTFKNNYGQTCRHFKEVLKVHTIQQKITGLACPRHSGAWCKLRPNSTPVCDISGGGGFKDWINDAQRSIGDLFR